MSKIAVDVLEVEVDTTCAAGAGAGAATPVGGECAATAAAAAMSKDCAAEAGFEGPEKVLEIDFDPSLGPSGGLRALKRHHWDAVVAEARATILSADGNRSFDSYVLSESSLFVYPYKLILKTCGTTTLLRAIPKILELSKEIDMKVEWVLYTRKDFTWPAAQLFPHTNPNEEVEYLKKYFDGEAFVLGPITRDHWFLFIADMCDRPSSESTDRTLDMMMFGIDPEVAKLFMKDATCKDEEVDATKASGIDLLLPGARIQDHMFDPCGYSCNAILFDAYFTIHVTPESEFSYASFETNIRQSSYSVLIKHVLEIFKPKRFTMTMFADRYGYKEIVDDPFASSISLCRGATYQQTARSQSDFCNDQMCVLSNYTLSRTISPVRRARLESV